MQNLQEFVTGSREEFLTDTVFSKVYIVQVLCGTVPGQRFLQSIPHAFTIIGVGCGVTSCSVQDAFGTSNFGTLICKKCHLRYSLDDFGTGQLRYIARRYDVVFGT